MSIPDALVLPIPEFHVAPPMADVMDLIMATAGDAGKSVRLDGGKRSWVGIVNHAFFKGASAKMAMETYLVAERLIELDILRQRGVPKVVDVQVPQAAKFRFDGPEHGVIGVTGVTSLVRGNAMILKMRRCQIAGIVDVQAPSVRLHNVAGKTEGGALGTRHFILHAHGESKKRKKEEDAERQNLPRAADGDRGANNNHSREHSGEQNKKYGGDCRHGAGADERLFTSSGCE